jgi:hypothetical protein
MLAIILCHVRLASCAALRDVPTPELGLTPCYSPRALHYSVFAGYTACIAIERVLCLIHIPPVLWTFKTLSLPPSCWNALTSGAATVKTAH